MKDGSVEVKLQQTAQNVCIKLMDGPGFNLEKDAQGVWVGRFAPGMGFSYADVPDDGDDFYQPCDGPCPTVVRHYYASKVTGELESCLVYRPPRNLRSRRAKSTSWK